MNILNLNVHLRMLVPVSMISCALSILLLLLLSCARSFSFSLTISCCLAHPPASTHLADVHRVQRGCLPHSFLIINANIYKNSKLTVRPRQSDVSLGLRLSRPWRIHTYSHLACVWIHINLFAAFFFFCSLPRINLFIEWFEECFAAAAYKIAYNTMELHFSNGKIFVLFEVFSVLCVHSFCYSYAFALRYAYSFSVAWPEAWQ